MTRQSTGQVGPTGDCFIRQLSHEWVHTVDNLHIIFNILCIYHTYPAPSFRAYHSASQQQTIPCLVFIGRSLAREARSVKMVVVVLILNNCYHLEDDWRRTRQWWRHPWRTYRKQSTTHVLWWLGSSLMAFSHGICVFFNGFCHGVST